MVCEVPRCRQPVFLTYLGKGVCYNCWKKFCDEKIDLIEKLKLGPRRSHSDKPALPETSKESP